MSSLQTSSAVTSVLAITFNSTTGSIGAIVAAPALPYMVAGIAIVCCAYAVGKYVEK